MAARSSMRGWAGCHEGDAFFPDTPTLSGPSRLPFEKFSIGLTGGIGSGKSFVADLFAALGASVIDTDQIAHQLLQRLAREPLRRGR